ncbi:unnamed protein product [Urochloa decumbens]|uniref:Uncharacterized protein n=1 Tax=Urochloa decumbens TaxID=240449 RepID=A0ABC8YJ46_9POAL
MASMKLCFTFILLLSGVLLLGGTEAVGAERCIQGAYLTCDNYPSKQLAGCDCQLCTPRDGKNCRLHFLTTGGTFDCPAR